MTPHSGELLEQQLARDPSRSPEEVIERALEAFSKSQPAPAQQDAAVRTPADAVAAIMEIQRRNRLDGLKIKDLIHEGHRY